VPSTSYKAKKEPIRIIVRKNKTVMAVEKFESMYKYKILLQLSIVMH